MHLSQPHLFRGDSYIDGNWISDSRAGTMEVANPVTLGVTGRIGLVGAGHVREAVGAASRALASWRNVPVRERAALLECWGQLMLRNEQDLARIISTEQGKPAAEALGEVRYAASYMPWSAAEAQRTYGRTIPSHIDGTQLGTMLEPAGVAALITPWNFPLAMLARKAAAALAAGCTVVAKPAHETPFSALALAVMAQEAGIPNGVFNVVLGAAAPTVDALVRHPDVRVVSFTGSTRVGLLVQRAAAEAGVKKLALELGGNAPLIVAPGASIRGAVDVAVAAKFQNAGQDCCAVNRIFVHRASYAEFLLAYVAAVSRLHVGPASDERSTVGPLMHEAALSATQARVADAIAQGARLLIGGHQHVLGGCFFEPTVLADVKPGMRVYDEENFAPISGVCAYDSLDMAVDAANDTEHGLAAYVCSNQHDVIWKLLRRLKFGMVAVNSARFTGAPIPFGGIKASGLGREGGAEGLEPFADIKYYCLGGLPSDTHSTSPRGAS